MTKLVFYSLLRHNVKYEIIILLFIWGYSSLQNTRNQMAVAFSVTMLSILLIVYFHILVRQKGRVTLLYKGGSIKKLKMDFIKALVQLSVVFLIIAIGIDGFLWGAFYLIIQYFCTLGIFILSTLAIPINIEKREEHNPTVVTFREGLKIIGLSVVLLSMVQNVI